MDEKQRTAWATRKDRKAYLKLIRARDGSLTCHWCGASPRRSIDHIVSRSNGGPNALWNFVASCADCNGNRGNTDDPDHCDFCRAVHARFRHSVGVTF